MSEEDPSQADENKSVSARQIGFYFILLALFAPSFVLINWGHPAYPSFSVWGMVWRLYNSVDFGGWYLDYYWPFFVIGQSIQYTLLRPIFAYQIARYYQNKSSKKMTLLIGLIVESQPFVMGLYSTLNLLHLFLEVRLPIPVLLIAAFLVMKFAPPREELESWLDEKKDDSEKMHLSRLDISYKILETVLVSEIILLIWGGLFVFNLSPFSLRIFYWIVLPWLTLITGILFLIVRYLRKTYLLEEVPS
ncbi:MAG: hypothetical protein RTU63_06035 [Candidatus Thorarchaeota archaeon]